MKGHDRESGYVSGDGTKICSPSVRYFRKLGALESLSHRYHQHGIDITSQLFILDSTRPVTPCNLSLALRCLSKQHPLLRARIAEKTDNGLSNFYFVEMDHESVDFAIIDADDWEKVIDEEVSNQFDAETGPLWRCRLLRNRRRPVSKDERFKYTSVLTLTWHHGIFDAMYLQKVFGDLVEFLDKENLDISTINSTTEKQLHLPIEKVLQDALKSKRSQEHKAFTTVEKSRYVSVESANECSLNNTKQAIDAYRQSHTCEIAQLSLSKPAPRSMHIDITQEHTDRFIQSCRKRNVSISGAIIAASCLSLHELVCSVEGSSDEPLQIPLEFMADVRPYLDMFGYPGGTYAGLAAIHIPYSLTIHSSRKAGDSNFWQYAAINTSKIRNILQSEKPLDIVKTITKENCSNSCVDIPRGKSQYVLCVSNCGKSNGLVRQEQINNFKVSDVMGGTSILNDDMPIFFVLFATLRGKLKGYVSYCSNYTSEETAAKFTERLRDYITCQQPISRL